MMERVFDALAADRRQEVLTLLTYHDSVELEDVVEYCDGSSDMTRASLYHNHLPKLDDLGAINWNSDAGTVSRGEDFQLFSKSIEGEEEPGCPISA